MSLCSLLKTQYASIKTLKAEFDLALETATSGAATPEQAKQALERAKALKAELEQQREILSEMLWPFEYLSQREFQEQYEKAVYGYRKLGLLETLSSGHEGITDEQGKEHPLPSLQEIKKSLLANKEFYAEKFATLENPRVHLTPFVLNPKKMAEQYSQQIEEHFVEEKTEGDRRIPDKDKTKLFGVNGDPLELKTDKQNVYFDSWLSNVLYFPKWKEEGSSVKAEGGITKEQAITQIGGWRMLLIENIPLAPEKGQGKEIAKEIKIKGQLKKVNRKQVEGGLNAKEQYEFLKQQNEEGFTLEDCLSFAMLYLEENNIVLDDDRRTNYYCRLLGAAAAGGYVPYASWYRDDRQAFLYRYVPDYSDSDSGVRAAVPV